MAHFYSPLSTVLSENVIECPQRAEDQDRARNYPEKKILQPPTNPEELKSTREHLTQSPFLSHLGQGIWGQIDSSQLFAWCELVLHAGIYEGGINHLRCRTENHEWKWKRYTIWCCRENMSEKTFIHHLLQSFLILWGTFWKNTDTRKEPRDLWNSAGFESSDNLKVAYECVKYLSPLTYDLPLLNGIWYRVLTFRQLPEETVFWCEVTDCSLCPGLPSWKKTQTSVSATSAEGPRQLFFYKWQVSWGLQNADIRRNKQGHHWSKLQY